MEQPFPSREADVEWALWERLNSEQPTGNERQVNIDAGRIDIITPEAIYEVKDFKNWKAAIGQVLVYRIDHPNRKPVIYLFGKALPERRKMIQRCCDALGVELQWHGITPAPDTGKTGPDLIPRLVDDGDDYDGDIYPSTRQFIQALQQVAPSKKRKQMLQAHYNAPLHTITATQLTQALGYKNFAAANLHYGLFAKRVREALNWWHYPGIHICIFTTFSHRNGEWHWTMLPELAAALEELGWVEPVD
jgi:hypothetical protein